MIIYLPPRLAAAHLCVFQKAKYTICGTFFRKKLCNLHSGDPAIPELLREVEVPVGYFSSSLRRPVFLRSTYCGWSLHCSRTQSFRRFLRRSVDWRCRWDIDVHFAISISALLRLLVSLAAAAFATRSASSFPGTPAWPGHHRYSIVRPLSKTSFSQAMILRARA